MVKLKIKDVEWSFIVLKTQEYHLLHQGSSAVTESHKRLVTFDESDITKDIVAHELFHVYMKSCCTNSTDSIDGDDVEEIGAEIIEYHLDDIVKYRNYLWKKLKPKKKAKKR